MDGQAAANQQFELVGGNLLAPRTGHNREGSSPDHAVCGFPVYAN
jgi:hypothetical protein